MENDYNFKGKRYTVWTTDVDYCVYDNRNKCKVGEYTDSLKVAKDKAIELNK